jgi:uncharacterized membrane protein YhaH (DUF805 family)
VKKKALTTMNETRSHKIISTNMLAVLCHLALSFSLRAIQKRRQTDTTRSLKYCTVVFFIALSRHDDRQTQLDHLNLVLSFSLRAIQTRRQTETARSFKSCTVVLLLFFFCHLAITTKR